MAANVKRFSFDGVSYGISVGQPVYVLDMDKRRPSDPARLQDWMDRRAWDGVVAAIGRKYVTVRSPGGTVDYRFYQPEYETGGALVESTEIGSPQYLFPTEAARSDYLERESLLDWFRQEGKARIEKAPLDALRKIRSIVGSGAAQARKEKAP